MRGLSTDAALDATARQRAHVFATDGKKACLSETNAPPHPGRRLRAAKITDGAAGR